MAFEKYFVPENGKPNLFPPAVASAMNEYIDGVEPATKADFIAYIELILEKKTGAPYSLDSDELADIDTTFAEIDAAADYAAKRVITAKLLDVITINPYLYLDAADAESKIATRMGWE